MICRDRHDNGGYFFAFMENIQESLYIPLILCMLNSTRSLTEGSKALGWVGEGNNKYVRGRASSLIWKGIIVCWTKALR